MFLCSEDNNNLEPSFCRREEERVVTTSTETENPVIKTGMEGKTVTKTVRVVVVGLREEEKPHLETTGITHLNTMIEAGGPRKNRDICFLWSWRNEEGMESGFTDQDFLR